MDSLTLLLMHTLYGLKITADEWARLLRRPGDEPRSLAEQLHNPWAREYFRQHTDWLDQSWRWAEEGEHLGVRWCHWGQPDYPQLWRGLTRAPRVFAYRGHAVWMNQDLLAVVGSRTPSTQTSLWLQRELGEFLRGASVGIVSGGARGVDQWAHRLALDLQRPTVCILPTGILNPYPFDQEKLWHRIVSEGGCLISTFSLREPIRKSAFSIRNRWIAGLARAVFVAEANRRSGSALTAQLAQEEDRPVATVPVFPHSEQGLANLDLIVDRGATLLRDSRDLITFWNLSCAHVSDGLLGPTASQGLECE